jgi:hypothetical protein
MLNYKGGYGTFHWAVAGNGVYTQPLFLFYDGSGNQVSTVGTGSSYNDAFLLLDKAF